MANKDDLKAKFATGKKPTGDDFAALIDGVEGPQGAKGDKGDTGAAGAKGDTGAKGAAGTNGKDGLSPKALVLATDANGKVTGGTLTLSDDSTVAVTVTTGE